MPVSPLISSKVILTAVFAAISMRFGAISDLLLLFILAIILDYVTGIAAAVYNRQLSSDLGLRGIIKKVGMFCVISVAIISDEVVSLAANHLGVALSTGGTIASVVTVWLILNELISILENIAKLNVDLPPFLLSAIKLLKRQTETVKKIDSDENEPDENKPDNPRI